MSSFYGTDLPTEHKPGQLDPGSDAEFPKYLPEMEIGRVRRQVQLGTRLAVGQTLGNRFRDRKLRIGEAGPTEGHDAAPTEARR